MRKYKGITLIESTVYLGIFAMLFLAMMQFYFTIGTSNQRSSAQTTLQKNKIFLSEHTELTIRDSDGLDVANSIIETDSSSVRFHQGDSYVEYYVIDGVLYLDDGNVATRLTPPTVEVERFRADLTQDSDNTLYYLQLQIDLRDKNIDTIQQEIELFYITS